jgi:hypothetical protein
MPRRRVATPRIAGHRFAGLSVAGLHFATRIRSAKCRAAGMLVASAMIAAPVAAHAEPRAVVELFTSQGCSSCPAADKLLGELAHDPSVVAMSLPIDYWDYLGWKDTLANPGHSARQRAYSKLRGDREVYTPQVVVNGMIHVLGSDKAAIERAIVTSDKETTPEHVAAMSLPVALAVSGGKLHISVSPAKDVAAGGEVWLCALSGNVPVVIGRGENHGHTIVYHNVARRWIKLGDFSGHAENWTVPLTEFKLPDVNSAAVIVQTGTSAKPGMMLGAAVTQLR